MNPTATIMMMICLFCVASCASSDPVDDRKNVYMAEGFQNLGKYSESIKYARKVKRGSEFYREARSILKKSKHAKNNPDMYAYDTTRVPGFPVTGWKIDDIPPGT